MGTAPKKGITPASAKAKGRAFQQLVRDKIRGILKPYGVVREDVESRGMGQQGSDIILSPLAKRFLPVEIECKSLAKSAIYGPYEQAKTHGDLEPVVAIKANRKEPLVVISLDYYLYLEQRRLEREHLYD